MYVGVYHFQKAATGEEIIFKKLCQRMAVKAAREARLAPRAADMGREEQNWLKNGEKQERCCQQRRKQLEGEQRGRKRLFLNWAFSWFAEFANWALCLSAAAVSYRPFKFQQTESQKNKCLQQRVFPYLLCFPYLCWFGYTFSFIPTLPDFLGVFLHDLLINHPPPHPRISFIHFP